MSSGGSNLEPTARGDEIQSSKPVAVESSEVSPKDRDVCSIQTSDMFDRPLSHRAERLVTRHDLKIDPMTTRRDLAKAIIRHDYPLSIVNDRGFKTLFFGAYPAVSQSTLKSDILKIYEFEKSRSMALFKETTNRIAITTHKWVSCDQTKRFLAITGHMVDDDSVRHCMMRFVNVPCSYTSESLAQITAECLFEWEVATKLSTIAIENSSSDLVFSDILSDKLSSTSLILGGRFLRTECFAHVVSLMVQDAFAVIANVIDKIRESILFWAATPQREREFQEASHELGISVGDNKLVLDCVTKWNTTFLMLQKALECKTVFCHLKKSESEFSCMPSEEEWESLKEICEKLGLLYDTLERVSVYKSANLGLLPLSQIKRALSKWVLCDNMEVREMASKMTQKFDKYCLLVRDTFAVALVLDPRFKLELVEVLFQKMYGDEAQGEIEHIRQLCYELFNEYRAKLDLEKVNNGDNGSSSSLEDSENDGPSERLFKMFLRDERKRKRKRQEPQKHELDAYLESNRIQSCGKILDYNPLYWWRWESSKYPTLKKMARDFLAIPICSVPPENMFDIGDSVLSPHRSGLHPSMVETLMCAQSCLWTSSKGSYSITNSYSWVTNHDYAAVEDHAAEGAKQVQSS